MEIKVKFTPKTALLSIIAAPFVLVIIADYASRISQNLSSVPPSVTPTPTAKLSVTPRKPIESYADEYAPEYKMPASESAPKDDSTNPETWTSSRPNAMVIESTEVTSMLGESTYSTLRRGQLIRLTGKREGDKVGIEGDYALFKATGYVNITDIKLMNLLEQAP